MISAYTGRVSRRGAVATSVLLSLGALAAPTTWAQSETAASRTQTQTYTLDAQALGAALQQFAAQAGLQLLFSESDVASLQAPALKGSFTPDQALGKLLAGSGLKYEFLKADAVIIKRTEPAPTSASTADFKEVIVTGRAGIDQRTKQETSYSVTTIDQKKLRQQGPTSVTESLKSVPGFWVEASGGEASGNVRARGIPVDGFGSITLLEDGMPVQHDPALGYLNGDQAFRLDETIDRIEVVRGGPSSIFYSNAPAGAVNYIPRRVGDHAAGVVKYTAGDYGLNRLDVWYGAPVGDWTVALGGFYRYDDGIRDPGFHGDDGGQFRVSLARDFAGGKVSFDLKRLDDKVYLDLGIPMRSSADGSLHAVPGFDGNFGTVAGPETAYSRMKTASGNDFLFDNSLGTDIKRTQATLNFEFEFADGYRFSDHARYDETDTIRNGVFPNTVQSASSFLASQSKGLPAGTSLQLRYTTSPNTVFDVANQNGNALMIVGGLRSVTSPVKELMNDARIMRKFELGSQTHDATVGFYVANIDQDFSRYSSTALLDVENNSRLLDLVSVDPAGVATNLTDHGIFHYGYEWANATGQSTTTAFYLADEWQITDALRVDAGARWEQVHLTANTELRTTANLNTPATSQILTGTGTFAHFDQTFSKVGWTLGANWQFNPHSGLFARYTPTFRLPNLSTYTTASLTTSNPTVPLPVTQTMDLAEIGYKFANEWTDLYATAFWTKYNNVGFTNNVFNVNTSLPPVPQQLYADTKTYGVELDGGLYPVEFFDLTFNATLEQPKYSGLRYTDSVGGQPVQRDFDGNQLIRVPKVSVRVVPGVNLFGQRLRLQASWEWEGARYVDTANTVVLPKYDVLNVSGRFSFNDHFELYGYVDNVTNSLGLTEGNPRLGEVQNADAGANTFIARPLLGRSYRMSVLYKF